MENLNHKERSASKLCKKWMVIEKCSWCVFETLCLYEENVKKKNEKKDETKETN